MRTITVSSKNQITIPVAILREVGINPGDTLAAAVIDGDIVLVKEPESWVQYLQGSMGSLRRHQGEHRPLRPARARELVRAPVRTARRN